jgi:hypothetical protein
MKSRLILVHSGNLFPEYLNDCIELSLRQNLDIDLLISSNFHDRIKHQVNLEKIEDYYDDLYSNFSNKSFDNNFRDGFWNRTSSRFFIISNYAKAKNLKSFFHIENDVALFSNLIKFQNILEKTNKEVALVMDAPNRCIPSIMWFKDHCILNDISNYIFKNNHLNDMQSLSEFFHINRDRVFNFPIIPKFNKNSNIDYSNYFDEFNSIFDGAAIGQYLFGIDCLENPNKKTTGFVNETTIFKSSDFRYFFKNGYPYMILDSNEEVPINNLHMHCKNLKQLI